MRTGLGTLLPSDQINFLQPIPNSYISHSWTLARKHRKLFLCWEWNTCSSQGLSLLANANPLTQSMGWRWRKQCHIILHTDNLYAMGLLSIAQSFQSSSFSFPRQKSFPTTKEGLGIWADLGRTSPGLRNFLRNLHWRQTLKMKAREEKSGPTFTSHYPLQEGMAPWQRSKPLLSHVLLAASLQVSKIYFSPQRGCKMPLDPSRSPAWCLYAVMVLPSASSLLIQENLQWKQWETLNCLRSNQYSAQRCQPPQRTLTPQWQHFHLFLPLPLQKRA